VIFVVIVNFPTRAGVCDADAGAASPAATDSAATTSVRGLLIGILSPVDGAFPWVRIPVE